MLPAPPVGGYIFHHNLIPLNGVGDIFSFVHPVKFRNLTLRVRVFQERVHMVGPYSREDCFGLEKKILKMASALWCDVVRESARV